MFRRNGSIVINLFIISSSKILIMKTTSIDRRRGRRQIICIQNSSQKNIVDCPVHWIEWLQKDEQHKINLYKYTKWNERETSDLQMCASFFFDRSLSHKEHFQRSARRTNWVKYTSINSIERCLRRTARDVFLSLFSKIVRDDLIIVRDDE